MRESTVAAYAREADALEYGPHTYGGPWTKGMRAYRAHHPKARVEFLNIDGRRYWMTAKMMRVYSIVTRISGSSDQMTTMREIAQEAKVSPGYALKVVKRLQAWSMIRAISSRGRYGGTFLIAVKKAVSGFRSRVASFTSNVSSVRLRGREDASVRRMETLERPWAEIIGEMGL